MLQGPMCAREKKQVTVGHSLLALAPPLQPAFASGMKQGTMTHSPAPPEQLRAVRLDLVLTRTY